MNVNGEIQQCYLIEPVVEQHLTPAGHLADTCVYLTNQGLDKCQTEKTMFIDLDSNKDTIDRYTIIQIYTDIQI